MNIRLLYSKMLSLKARGKNFILILTEETIKQLIKNELPIEAEVEGIITADIWFAGTRVYIGKMDKIILIEGEIWLK